ncbi:hypothetical protein D0Z07_4483, partial [Hyphodiscus hymeniophilus]
MDLRKSPAADSECQSLSLMGLPTELHLLISKHLIYPDALSLKHTNRHFYNLVYTGVNLKVEWLIKRRRLHLDCPNDKKCELGSDMRFCRGRQAFDEATKRARRVRDQNWWPRMSGARHGGLSGKEGKDGKWDMEEDAARLLEPEYDYLVDFDRASWHLDCACKRLGSVEKT